MMCFVLYVHSFCQETRLLPVPVTFLKILLLQPEPQRTTVREDNLGLDNLPFAAQDKNSTDTNCHYRKV